MNSEQIWLPTSAAVRVLGISAATPKRRRDIDGGFLIADVDWRYGVSANSPLLWRIERIGKAFHERQMRSRRQLISTADSHDC